MELPQGRTTLTVGGEKLFLMPDLRSQVERGSQRTWPCGTEQSSAGLPPELSPCPLCTEMSLFISQAKPPKGKTEAAA